MRIGERRHYDEVHNFIVQYQLEHGYCPTIRDIKNGLGYSTTSYVAYILNHLAEEGKVDWVVGKSRTIHSIEAP
jgi:SOS-response transcriptional repressor LexA